MLPIKAYSDKTDLDDLHEATAWPLHMTLENIPLRAQCQLGGHELVAFIPQLEPRSHPDPKQALQGIKYKRRKQQFTQDCLDVLLAELRPYASRSALLLNMVSHMIQLATTSSPFY